MEKLEVQHNMFIELLPEKYLKDEYGYEGPVIVKKTDIKKCHIEHFREECRHNNRDREPFHIITIEMKDGTKHEERYENLTGYGYCGDVKELVLNRYAFIKQQLCDNANDT